MGHFFLISRKITHKPVVDAILHFYDRTEIRQLSCERKSAYVSLKHFYTQIKKSSLSHPTSSWDTASSTEGKL